MQDIELALMVGCDIPIPECQIILHQPTIYEIGLMGEAEFFQAISYLCIDKNILKNTNQDIDINTIKTFALLQEILNQEPERRELIKEVLIILFPTYKILISPRSFVLTNEGNNFVIDEDNFPYFQNVLRQVFCLAESDQKNFNPSGKKAQEIANKLIKARQRVAAQKKANGEQGSTLSQYISVLTVGISSMSLQDCIQLTIFQVYNLLQRFNLFVAWDLDTKCRLAGGKPETKVENWMKKLH